MKFLVAIFLIGWIIYLISRVSKFPKTPKKKDGVENLVECAVCKTYVSSEEAITKQGRVFCSQHCLHKGA
ncbi:PP0621 family protein [Helicobacter cynogastricus]|uniref:PP0621 family protein n=1 Tax=Helicobacter cynogastricus TaxID=329937 RepID=UPI000CF19413|nr:PP0621 family protein [Helicobacter cynogastricus]